MMKKYLMLGVAALALASCSKDEIAYQNPDEVKYEQVFTQRFGEPSSNQTWGFGYGITRGSKTEANLYGDTGYDVPTPLTPQQKLRVQKYFQYNKNPHGTAIDYKNFFVQDVYKGATDALNDGSEANSQYSTEKYTFGNAQEAGSAHMDKLTAGSIEDHINNYNNATCSINNNVWNGELDATKGADKNDQKVYYSDAIMLMVDSKTDCFGWHETQGDVQHNDQYVIISAATIDKWANDNKDVINDDLGDPVTDKYNRNFVGFDYEAKINLADCYAFPNGWDEYVWDSEANEGKTIHHEGVRTNEDGVPYISSGTYDNQASVTVVPAGTAGAYPVWERYVDSDQSKGNVWVKLGCADGYYSDWIVCITEGVLRNGEDPDAYDIRVMAEDLQTSENSDFDFNDVVFDVKWMDEDGNTAKILVQAAGGINPIRINGDDTKEVHKLLGGNTTMLNTYAGNHNQYSAEPFIITGTFNKNAANITVEVQKQGIWTELKAPTGKVASKIGVPVTVDWCDEFQDIDDKWGEGKFEGWVNNPENKFWH